MSLSAYQFKFKDDFRKINIKSESAFAWSMPQMEHTLILEFFLGDLNEFPIETGKRYKFSFDKIN